MFLAFSNPKHNIRLDRILVHSEQLANDIEFCHKRYMANKAEWNKTERTVASQIGFICSKFEKLMGMLNLESLKALLGQGLSALKNNRVWDHLEYAALRTGKGIKNAFITLARLFNNDIDLQPPSRIDLKGYVTDIAKLYGASDLLFNHYRDFVYQVLDTDRPQKQLRDIKASTHATLIKLMQKDSYRELLAKYGLGAFVNNTHILTDAAKMDRYNSIHFQLMLSHYDSETFIQKSIIAKGKYEVSFTELYRISQSLFNDIEQYSNVIGHSKSSHLKAASVRDKLTGFKRALPILQSELSDDLNSTMLADGLKALLNSDKTLKQLHDSSSLPSWVFSLIHEICTCIYPDNTPKLSSFRDNLFSFPNIDNNRELLCDFSSIKVISHPLYTDFASFLESCKVDIDQRDYSMVTVYHNYQQLKSLLNKYSGTLNHQHLAILRQHGINGFGIDGGLIQNHLLAELQSSVNNGSFNRITARIYRSSLSWLLREFGIPFNNTYPIKSTKTVKHKQRLNTDDFYTEQQCRELAFYIEKLLRDGRTNLYHRILLTFGKVVLKTGWNISPLLRLECDDIAEVVSPITNKTEYAIVLQKARSGYRSDTYTFDKSELKSNTLKSAIADLLTIRDELTTELRAQTELRNYLFIYPRNDEVLKLEYSAVKHLSTLLKKAGCSVPFVAKKIRKGGVNHIYRKVNKNIKKYTSTVKHSFDVFESNYLRINPEQSRYSLSQATKIMSDYFTGKEVSSDIHIITDMNANQHQIVPTGTCAAKGQNEETKRYAREHRKLHQTNVNSNQKMCADFLSCVWCKYFRVVADAEHVWKLLSYKNYILQDMEMSVVDFDDTDNQITNINVLKQRVDDIIDNLRERKSKAVEDGFALIKQHGIHPDWEFATPSFSIFDGEF